MLCRGRTRFLVAAGSWLVSTPALADGELLAAECPHGTIVDVSAGGNLSGAPRFARGIDDAGRVVGICQGPDGLLYAVAASEGAVYDITDGGNLAGAEPFATGFDIPIDLHCDAERMLLADWARGTIYDITEGGDFSDAPGYAVGLPGPTHVNVGPDGRVFASTWNTVGIYEITGGGDFAGRPRFAWWNDGGNAAGIAALGTLRFTASSTSDAGNVYEWSDGGNQTGEPFATGLPASMGRPVATPDGLFIATGPGAIYDITAGGDVSDAAPFATGIRAGCGYNGLYYVQYCGDGLVAPGYGEDCDDGNDIPNDGCTNTCALPRCGDGIVQRGEACDGGDGCSDECTLVGSDTSDSSGGDGSDDDVDGSGGETTGSAGTTDGSDEGSDDGIDPDGSTGIADGTDSAGATTDDLPSSTVADSSGAGSESGDDGGLLSLDDDGCSCRSGGPSGSAIGWMLFGTWMARRRRSR